MPKKPRMAHVAKAINISASHNTGDFKISIPMELESKELSKRLKALSDYIKLAPDCYVDFKFN